MSPAEIAELRVRRDVKPKRKRTKHRPKPRSGEVEFFQKLRLWKVPFRYEPFFFPLEFYPDGSIKKGFQPDARLLATRRYPEVFVEISIGGYSLVHKHIYDLADYVRIRAEKQERIEALFRHYGALTVLIDGPLLGEIVDGPNGYERLLEEIDAVFDPAWEPATLALAA